MVKEMRKKVDEKMLLYDSPLLRFSKSLTNLWIAPKARSFFAYMLVMVYMA
jgi:hypothetical protein